MEHVEGLEGVVAVATRIGGVDGARGELIVRGHRMEEYAPNVTYERAVQDLWQPECGPVDAETIGPLRVAAFRRLAGRAFLTEIDDPMDVLRASLGALPPTGDRDDALAAAAMLAVSGPAWWRARNGLAPIEPDPSRGQADDYLRMLLGSPQSAAAVRAFETYLVTVMDHGMNASTFTARVIASTQSDMLSALAGALGALKGPLHGGAPGPVLDMLDAIGTQDQAERWIREALARGERIMGIGHRIYRVRDPRAEIFESALSVLKAPSDRLALARAVERAAVSVLAEARPDRALKANVEFYTAVLLEAVGVPRTLFTPVFAVGRVVGWSAHVMEQRSGRLIRPQSRYVA